jgi:hypothetical protein
MVTMGDYLYGFTNATFAPAADLRGLAAMRVRTVQFEDIAALVSRHPVKPLMPLRANLQPHHKVVRQTSAETTLLPAAFGHIIESERAIVDVLRANHGDIREQLDRLSGKCEMGVKLRWNVPNIFDFFVKQDRELRELRDRVFARAEPALPDRLQVGELFATKHARERERLAAALVGALTPVSCEVTTTPARDERLVCQAAVLIETARAAEFALALQRSAGLFDANFLLEYSGPWPAYSFVQLRLQSASAAA